MSVSKKVAVSKRKLGRSAPGRICSPVDNIGGAASDRDPASPDVDENPPKRVKTSARMSAGGRARRKELLPPVTITSPSVSAEARHGTVRRAMSIGDLSGDDIDAVVSPSWSRSPSPSVGLTQRVARGAEDLLDLEAEESVAEDDAADASSRSACGDISGSDVGNEDCSDDSFIVSDSVDVLGADRAAHTISDSDDAELEAPVHVAVSNKRLSRFSGRSRVPVRTEKGNYVATLLESGQQDDVAGSDNVEGDPSVSPSTRSAARSKVVRATVPTVSPEVFLDDLYPEPIVRTRGSPKKTGVGRGGRASPRKPAKTDPPADNKVMTVKLDIDPVTSSLRKTVGMGMPKSSEKDGDPRSPAKSVVGSRVTRSSAVATASAAVTAGTKRPSPSKGVKNTPAIVAGDSGPFSCDGSADISGADTNAVAHIPSHQRNGIKIETDSVAVPLGKARSKQPDRTPSRKTGGDAEESDSVAVPSEKARGKQPDRAPSHKATVEEVDDIDDEPDYLSCRLREQLSKLLGASARDSSPEGETSGPVLRLGSVSRIIPTVLALDTSEPEDETLRVMQAHLMEEYLIALQIYEGLPILGPFRAVVPTGMDPDTYDAPMFFTFDDVKELYSVGALTALLECFKFRNYGCYVNPATIPPMMLSMHNRNACIDRETAVCIMPGVVSECLLFDSAIQGGYQGATGVHGGKRSHRIRIKPFQQFWRRDQTAWAVVLDLAYGESASVSDSGVSFPTRVEDLSGKTNKNSRFPSAPSSPSKWRSSGKASGKALKSSLPPRVGAGYATSLGFGDDVPIYDGRSRAGSHFLFRPTDFTMLKLLPRYTEERDLDAFTLVAVGYSLGVWSGYNDQPRVSTNVLFVIVLGSVPPTRTLEAHNLLA